jgi:hypothetical protein
MMNDMSEKYEIKGVVCVCANTKNSSKLTDDAPARVCLDTYAFRCMRLQPEIFLIGALDLHCPLHCCSDSWQGSCACSPL